MKLRVLLLVLFLAACKGPDPADPAADLNAMQGTWTLVSSTYEGESQKPDMQWVVNGSQYQIRYNQVLDNTPVRFTLDGGQKHIDGIHHETPAGTIGGKIKGIYKLSGNSLTVCLDLTEAHYPSSFAAPRGSRQVVYEFRRQ